MEERTRIKDKKPYHKPEYKLEERMDFMFDALKDIERVGEEGNIYMCRQCSSCHG